ncbi:MAG: NAD-dependent epimerase/dehydratase family protein [Verrucomicrobiota bacterium]
MPKRILIAGAGGFIGGHLVGKLLSDGNEVMAVDNKSLDRWYQRHQRAENRVLNLEERQACFHAAEGCQEIYNLACNMGGMGFIENNRALCMLSVLINTHLLMAAKDHGIEKYFYASSACVYPDYRQQESAVTALKESDAYPAMPENGYGWEKLFSERMCRHFQEDFDLEVRIARLHNVYGPWGTWDGGREKAPAAICRKVLESKDSGHDELIIWGDGEQTRSFMYINDCLEGIARLMNSAHSEPINLGRSELVTINRLVDLVEEVAGIRVERRYQLDAPQGVRGRNSDNQEILSVLGWQPEIDLRSGIDPTYIWIEEQFQRRKNGASIVL